MDAAQKEELRLKIEEELAKTKSKIEEYKEFTKPIAPENAIGRVSRMDAINNKSVNEAALRKAEQKLKGLQVALNNLEDPDFGKCARCKNDIPVGRILLMPHARFCVHCAR